MSTAKKKVPELVEVVALGVQMSVDGAVQFFPQHSVMRAERVDPADLDRLLAEGYLAEWSA